MQQFKLPDLGEGLPDAEIHEWHVNVGDTVEVDQPLVSMETAKAVVDVPSPHAGKITKLYGEPGDVIKTGAPLVEFDEASETSAPTPHKDSSTVVGSIASSEVIETEDFIIGSPQASSASPAPQATPAVRQMAKELGIDLHEVTPQREDGMITANDLQASLSQTAMTSPVEKIETLHGVRRSMAINMAKATAEVALVTLNDVADIAHWDKTADITVRVIEAIVKTCEAEPALNAWFNAAKLSRQLHQSVNLGIAIDSKEGLFVPIIQDAASKSSTQLRTLIDQYKQQVSDRSIAPENLQGATITLSNYGNLAGRYATPIVMPPTVAIIGVGRTYKTPVVTEDEKITPHTMLPLSLSTDHRAVTGGEAARFLARLINHLIK